MALLFMDSFDHYATADLTEKWSSISAGTIGINASTGRRGSASLRLTTGAAIGNPWLLKGISTGSPTGILGFAAKFSSLSNYHICGFYDVVAQRDHVMLQMNVDGSLSVYRGNSAIGIPGSASYVLLGTTTGPVISAGVFAFLEVKVTLSDTVGAVTVRVNGVSVLALTAQDTANTTLVWNSAWIGASQTSVSGIVIDYDDLYLSDGSGALPWSDFLGDCRVDARYPTASGASTGWTPSTGANWSCVDDAAPNDDTDYVSAGTSPLTDTYIVQDAPVVGAAIYGIQHNLSAKKTDAGSCSIAPVIRHSGVDYVGANLNPGTAYAVLQQIAAVNPGTGAAWTEAGFNAAEFGYKRTV